MILHPSFAEQLLLWGGLWAALVALWGSICLWVDRDARQVFGGALPWNMLFAAVGVLLLVVSWQGGLATLPLTALMVPALTMGYVAIRDTKARPGDKILSAAFARRTGRRFCARLGSCS